MSDSKPTYAIIRRHDDIEMDGKTGSQVIVLLKSSNGENSEEREYFVANDQDESAVLSAAAWSYEDGLNYVENGFVAAPEEVPALDKDAIPDEMMP